MFSLRIVSADHYMAEPCPGLDVVYSEFRSTKIFKLPVIRLYGPTRLGYCDLYAGHWSLQNLSVMEMHGDADIVM